MGPSALRSKKPHPYNTNLNPIPFFVACQSPRTTWRVSRTRRGELGPLREICSALKPIGNVVYFFGTLRSCLAVNLYQRFGPSLSSLRTGTMEIIWASCKHAEIDRKLDRRSPDRLRHSRSTNTGKRSASKCQRISDRQLECLCKRSRVARTHIFWWHVRSCLDQCFTIILRGRYIQILTTSLSKKQEIQTPLDLVARAGRLIQ